MSGDGFALDWARDELVHLIEIPSVSKDEHEVAVHVEKLAADLGIPARRQPVEGAGANLLLGWSSAPALLLNAHLDTVEPNWGWSGRAEVAGDTVGGLGAVDDGGSVVACLLALSMARDAGVPIDSLPVGVGFTVDEEKDGTGSVSMAENLRPRFVVTGEGSGLRLGLAEVGSVEVWIRVRGLAVHGALREEGDNAIEKAARLIIEIGELPFTTHVHPLTGRDIPSVGEIRGGQPLNLIPDLTEFRVDARVGPGSSALAVFEQLEAACMRFDASIEVVEIVEPFETAADAPLAAAVSRAASAILGSAPEPIGVLGWTDAHNFVDLAGSQAVVFGPGDIRTAHQHGERIDVQEVVACAKVYAELLASTEALLREG